MYLNDKLLVQNICKKIVVFCTRKKKYSKILEEMIHMQLTEVAEYRSNPKALESDVVNILTYPPGKK